MALVLIEEVLMGLEEAKDALEQAVATLSDITDDLHPDLGHDLPGVISQDFLKPLQYHAHMMDTLLEKLATDEPIKA